METSEPDADTHPVIIERNQQLSDEEYKETFEAVKAYVDEEDFKKFKPIHQRMLRGWPTSSRPTPTAERPSCPASHRVPTPR